jgi:hypothetical protein
MPKNCWLYVILAFLLGLAIGWYIRGRYCPGESVTPDPTPVVDDHKKHPQPAPDDGDVAGQTNIAISSVTLERNAPGTPPSQLSLSGVPAPPTGNDGKHRFDRVADLCAADALAGDPHSSLTWVAFPVKANDKLQLSFSGLVAIDPALVGTVNNPVFVSSSPNAGGTTFLVCLSGTLGGAPVSGCIEVTDAADAAILSRWLSATNGATSTAGATAGRAQLVLDDGSPKKATLLFSLAQ